MSKVRHHVVFFPVQKKIAVFVGVIILFLTWVCILLGGLFLLRL